ncbi:MAG: endolytic transglycosylase MltG [Minwuia sp.]|uniref:endolytic transglycosylase MltG n=1 Tax=Minwuia sp. TaxID=2493630 RepID=UPI003A895E3E
MKAILRLLLVLIVLGGAGAGYAVWRGLEVYREEGPLGKPALVVVEPGEGPRTIAALLVAEKVISNRFVFLAALRLTEDGSRLKAGEYRFEPGISMEQAIAKLVAGETVVRRLTVPEGMTSAAVLELIEQTPTLTGDVQEAGEGELLPETYHFSLGDKRPEVIRRMRQAMRATVRELWSGRAGNLPISTPEEAVILASIVEKETGVASERPRVASVFLNRLRKGMRLQSDPTVIYALTEGKSELRRRLTRTDLATDSPYNTYKVGGLPPGPIANPGRAAIEAVLNPMQTNDLYFVADGSGGHAFAETLDEHNRNVRRWRRLQKDRGG